MSTKSAEKWSPNKRSWAQQSRDLRSFEKLWRKQFPSIRSSKRPSTRSYIEARDRLNLRSLSLQFKAEDLVSDDLDTEDLRAHDLETHDREACDLEFDHLEADDLEAYDPQDQDKPLTIFKSKNLF